jgi:hypothetical protein
VNRGTIGAIGMIVATGMTVAIVATVVTGAIVIATGVIGRVTATHPLPPIPTPLTWSSRPSRSDRLILLPPGLAQGQALRRGGARRH